MRKSVIGIVPLIDYARDSYWMLPGYMDGIVQAGGLPVMLPLTGDRGLIGQMAEDCDGFLFTGGQDVSPELYGEARLPPCGECSPERDGMELALLDCALALDKPVLGICRGIQFLNAALGGTLYQDIPAQLSTELEHRQTPPYDRPIHTVAVETGTPLAALLGREELWVNSCHHQAVKNLSPRLRSMARAADGLVEGVFLPEKRFVWGVQWHPEFLYRTDEASRRILRAFVQAAEERGGGADCGAKGESR